MQIHELTKSTKINEGMFDTISNAFSNPAAAAAKAAGKLQQQGYGAGYQGVSSAWQDKHAQILKNPSVKSYVDGVTQAWLASPEAKKATATATTATSPQPTNVGKRFKIINPANQGVYYKTGNKWSTETGSPIADPKSVAYLEKLLDGGAGREEPIPVSEATTTPSTQVNSGKRVAKAFRTWADQRLETKSREVGTVNMSHVTDQYPDLEKLLDNALTNIANTAGTPQAEAAVTQYLNLAVAGLQGVSQTRKNKQGGSAPNQLGLAPDDLNSLKSLARTPLGKQLITKELGL